MKLKVSHPEWISDAVEKMESACVMDKRGILPDSIRGFMLAAPCKRLLRCVYGNSNIRVGWIIMSEGVREQASILWFRMRAKCGIMWLNEDERKAFDSVADIEEELRDK